MLMTLCKPPIGYRSLIHFTQVGLALDYIKYKIGLKLFVLNLQSYDVLLPFKIIRSTGHTNTETCII